MTRTRRFWFLIYRARCLPLPWNRTCNLNLAGLVLNWERTTSSHVCCWTFPPLYLRNRSWGREWPSTTEPIIQKPLQNASQRIHLMRSRLLRCKLKSHIVPGTRVCIADMLSRAHSSPAPIGENTPDEEMELRIHSLVSTLPISEGWISSNKQQLQTTLYRCYK